MIQKCTKNNGYSHRNSRFFVVQAGKVDQLAGVEPGVEDGNGSGLGVGIEGIGRAGRAVQLELHQRTSIGGAALKGRVRGVGRGQALGVAESERAAGLAGAHPDKEAMSHRQHEIVVEVQGVDAGAILTLILAGAAVHVGGPIQIDAVPGETSNNKTAARNEAKRLFVVVGSKGFEPSTVSSPLKVSGRELEV